MISSTFVLFSLIGAAYGAANDWTKPCLTGECFYDLPASAGSASGTLKVWGSADSITDITTAAGWEILSCDKNSLEQDIRLVCSGDQAKCDHLYQNIGAVGKIVRLPEACGQNAFAHISRAWVSEDQSLPEKLARRFEKRAEKPQVRALHIDTKFSASDAAKVGVVNFSIQAANVPGADTTASSSRVQKRQFGFLEDAVDAVTGLNDVNINESTDLPPISVDRTFNVLDETLSCPPIQASLKLDVTAKADARAAIGVIAQGTIVPPSITEFSVTTTMSANLNGAIKLSGGLTGSIESEKLRLLEVGIPGFAFPGILTVGPSFTIDAQAIASLDVNADLNVGVNYKIEKATLVFPPKGRQNQDKAFKLGNTPLELSVSPGAKATGTVEAHLIPSLNLGISALAGVAEATVFLELDAAAIARLTLEGRAQASATVNPRDAIEDLEAREPEPEPQDARVAVLQNGRVAIIRPAAAAQGPAAPQRGRVLVVRPAAAGAAARRPQAAQPTARRPQAAPAAGAGAVRRPAAPAAGGRVSTGTSASFGGCFEILAQLDVNAGANADFFGLFDAETSVPLFNREFELFKRCFGDPITRRALRFAREAEVTKRNLAPASILEKRELVCPPANAPALEELADGVIAANNVRSRAA